MFVLPPPIFFKKKLKKVLDVYHLRVYYIYRSREQPLKTKEEIKMKEFKLYDIEYTITACTAIAECDERNEAAE